MHSEITTKVSKTIL